MGNKCWGNTTLAELANKELITHTLRPSPGWGREKTWLPQLEPNVNPRGS